MTEVSLCFSNFGILVGIGLVLCGLLVLIYKRLAEILAELKKLDEKK